MPTMLSEEDRKKLEDAVSKADFEEKTMQDSKVEAIEKTADSDSTENEAAEKTVSEEKVESVEKPVTTTESEETPDEEIKAEETATEYVKEFCKKIDVEFFAKKVKVEEIAKELKIGTEEAGRNIRYEFFEEVAHKVGANKIATAHNLNDNAETVLMNIIRGTSVSGLKGIDKVRDGKYIRPIIECSRAEIEDYCKEKNLNPRYDKSNNENIYTRNKIRNLLIPFLQKEFNPNIVEGINRLSQIAIEEEQFINKVVEKEYEKRKSSFSRNRICRNEYGIFNAKQRRNKRTSPNRYR